jgi:hypothetical protein
MDRAAAITPNGSELIAGVPLGMRFPAAHQYLRHKLIEEVFPIEARVSSNAVNVGPDTWEVTLRWPEIAFEASERFSSDELRSVIGRWSTWARRRALDIADELPI